MAANEGLRNTLYFFEMDRELDEKVRDALHHYIEARGINEGLFPFSTSLALCKGAPRPHTLVQECGHIHR